MENDLIQNLEKLCKQPGVSKHEKETGFLDFLFEIVKNINPNTQIDAAGNIVSIIENPDKTIMLEAHMDEVGFVVKEKKDGNIILSSQGITKSEKVVGSDVFVVGKNIKGKVAISFENHLLFALQSGKNIKNIDVGDVVAFERFFFKDGDEIKASALDNRIGCSVLIEILKLAVKNGSTRRLVFVFSGKEEIDESSFKGIINSYPEVFALVVDAAYAQPVEFNTNLPDVLIPVLGEGCAVQTKGKDFIILEDDILEVKNIAKENNIKIQEEMAPDGFGKTNLAKLQKQGVKRGVVVNIPVRDQHLQISTTNLFDANEAVKLISEIVR